MSPFSINNDNTATNKDHIHSVLMNFLSVTPNDFDRASEHLELFISSSVPKSLISAELSHDLDLTMGTTGYVGLSFTLVRDFIAFLHPMWNVLWLMDNDTHEAKFYKKIGLPLCKMFYDLLAKITRSLRLLGYNDKKGDVLIVPWWSLYLDILKDLHNKSKLYKDMENDFWRIMKQVKVSLCILIAKFAEELEHYDWLFEHKEVTNFYIRRKLAIMMLPKVEDDEHDQYYMLIDRSKLLVDSFEYIAKLKNMPGSFCVEFKEEQATGPGVLRAWFLLASQEIFNPKNGLFVACPDDIEAFSQIKCRNISHLPFVLAAASEGVLLEDIRDADPFLYRGCKEILNMDAKKVDQDVLGLTFVCEVESLGLRRETELCPNGKDTVVDSKNMETYVNLLIQHHYVTSIADQVTYFLEGFSDVITMSRLPSFFRCLSLEDFNLMLGGRSDISVEDWKAHTDYHGYEESDLQIS
ncbi:hypothetical protein KY289_026826 [Solanum tuberosum]|nr:hypothetical protein KY289_026826 [Solanum tuberosum]